MPEYPTIHDKEVDLLKKIVNNTADITGGGGGGTGIPDSINGLVRSDAGTVTEAVEGVDYAGIDPATGWVPAGQLPPANPSLQGTYLVSGGAVAYLDNAYDFRASPAIYVINGVQYTSAQTDVALSAADPVNDRFDAIIVNSSGVVTVVTGTAAANPASPDIDPLTQLVLTTVLVRGGTTTPTITIEEIYKENTEWTSSESGGTINPDSSSSPFEGTKAIVATSAINGNYVRLTRASSMSLSGQKQLVFMLQTITNDWPNQKSLRLTFYLSGAKVGQTVAVSGGRYGFVDTNTASYQQVVIPVGDFQIPVSTNVDRLEILVNGAGAAISWRIDNVVLEPANTDVIQTNPSTATTTLSGTVKITTNETDPVVYTKADTDAAIAAALAGVGAGDILVMRSFN